MNKSAGPPLTGLIAGLNGVVKNGTGLLLTRLELAVLELSEARDHLLKLACVFSLLLVAICFSLACATVLVVVLSWAALGWKILALLAGGFLVLALVLLVYARALLRRHPHFLPATLSELKADRDIVL
ncbi:phage holin family protein [Paludibacterium yongneupense]|uniref:phage holin family protein n=1 Tax=Paludibacterium yongneupense TaxID=400061 RepID=UPI000422C662|nr:phage holin family protein [Paludibacterium yongneupense]